MMILCQSYFHRLDLLLIAIAYVPDENITYIIYM